MPQAAKLTDMPAIAQCNDDCRARIEAANIIAASNLEVATAIREAVAEVRPGVEFLASAGERLDKLCHFAKTKGLWVLASAPSVLLAVNAISPTAAERLHRLFAVLFGS